MNALKVHVERIVRPVRACHRRKDAWREELLAHLTRIYDEERARTGDAESSAAAAIARFGEAPALTAELQAGVSWIERWSLTPLPTFALFRRRIDESPRHYVVRATTYGLVWGTFCAVAVVAISLAFRSPAAHQKSNAAVAGQISLSMFAACAILFSAVMANGLLTDQIRVEFERRSVALDAAERRRANRQVACWVALNSVFWSAAALGFMFLLNSAIPGFVSTARMVAMSAAAGVASAPIILLQTRDWLLANRRFENWESLPLDDSAVAE
ncbi:MAG: hypothetical protein KF708_02405 [Pirellulales bacterium]|nr:hypothetical protein [Pirellulales bacterium]